jgi:glycerophosphoryl diester phosphodiesterase
MSALLKIAHRGFTKFFPENTLQAFKSSVDHNFDAVELDIQFSKDRQAMVFHDENLGRLTGNFAELNDLTLPQLKELKIDRKFSIPTFAEALEVLNANMLVVVEIKNPKAVAEVVNQIEKSVNERNWNYNQFIISAFDWTVLSQVALLNYQIMLGVLTYNELNNAMAFAEKIKANCIFPHFSLLNVEICKEIIQKRIKIYPWTVNKSDDIQRMKTLKINGIISDFPQNI